MPPLTEDTTQTPDWITAILQQYQQNAAQGGLEEAPGQLNAIGNLLRSIGIDLPTEAYGQAITDTMGGSEDISGEAVDPFQFDPTGKMDTILGIMDMIGKRRSASAEPGFNIASILDKIAAPGQELNAGFNPGGLADILAGIVSGQGTQAGMTS